MRDDRHRGRGVSAAVFVASDWVVRLGDALDLIRELPDCSVDMVFTDPPYGHNNNNGDLINRRPWTPDR